MVVGIHKCFSFETYPAIRYYKDYVFRFENTINFVQVFDNYSVGGYLRQGIINKDYIYKNIYTNNNYNIDQTKYFTEDASKNYFYRLYLKKKFYSFGDNDFSFGISYYDSIKYSEILNITTINDIYRRVGISFDYVYNYGYDNKLSALVDYTKSIKRKIKDNLTITLDNAYVLTENITFVTQYSYSKDIRGSQDHFEQTLFDTICFDVMASSLRDETHSFRVVDIISLSDLMLIEIGFEYSLSKISENNYSFMFNLAF
jgi:hypothetical protein